MRRDTAEVVVAKLKSCASDLNDALCTVMEADCSVEERAYFKREIAKTMNAIDQHLNQRIWDEHPDLNYLEADEPDAPK
jgi:hypothetical protein